MGYNQSLHWSTLFVCVEYWQHSDKCKPVCTGQGLANWPRMWWCWFCFFLGLFAEEIKHFVDKRLVFQGQFHHHQETCFPHGFFAIYSKVLVCWGDLRIKEEFLHRLQFTVGNGSVIVGQYEVCIRQLCLFHQCAVNCVSQGKGASQLDVALVMGVYVVR